MLAWIALIAALTGAGVLIDGLVPRAACAQVEAFVTNYFGDSGGSVTTYSRTANGNFTPLRIISGDATGLSNPAGLALDAVNNEILVANISSITVYSQAASGNAPPLRTISGAATGLAQPIGLAVDTLNDEILVANVSSITVYSRTASGNVAPLRTISGASTGLMDPFGLAVDTVNNEVLVANFGGNTITAYSRTADGDVAPRRTISGAATGLARPIGLAVDTVNNEILAANASSITAYSRTADGDVAPLRPPISGELTQLDRPLGLSIDAVNNEMLVANLGSNAVTVYGRTASGNAAPLRVISGPGTELKGPAFPAFATTCPSVFNFDFSDDTYARCFRDLRRGNEITAGQDLGTATHTSLNMQGTATSTPTTWLTVYDATPTIADPGPIFGPQTLCADVLIVPFNNAKGGGVVALLNEGVGKKGLALVIHDAGNTDTLFLATVDGDPAKKGKLKTLTSVSLRDGINKKKKSWYRVIMTVGPAPTYTVTGKVFTHVTPRDPNSPLDVQVGTTLTNSGLPEGVTSSGEIGILGSAIGAVLNVSVTNFTNNATQCGP
jgi:hypothetical protein